MSETAVLIIGISACAVVFASEGRTWTTAAFAFAAFIVWLSNRGVEENE